MDTAIAEAPAEADSSAHKIVAAICAFGYETVGIEKVTPAHRALLEPLSLREMLDAVEKVRAESGKKGENGSTSFNVTPDDRITASVYTLLHYKLRPQDEDDDLIVKFDEDGPFGTRYVNALIVIRRDKESV